MLITHINQIESDIFTLTTNYDPKGVFLIRIRIIYHISSPFSNNSWIHYNSHGSTKAKTATSIMGYCLGFFEPLLGSSTNNSSS